MLKQRKMGKFQKIKRIWQAILKNWKTKYRLVFSNEDTFEQRLIVRHITIKKVVVLAVIASTTLIILTAIIIALTPLRVYIPGFTSQKDYKLYRQAAAKIDSLEKVVAYNQAFIENMTAVAKETVPTTSDMDQDAAATPQVHPVERDKKRTEQTRSLLEESEKILGRVQKNNAGATPGIERAKISNLTIYPPAMGAVSGLFNPSERHFGIDILGNPNSTVCCSADGVVIFTGFNATDGHYLIVQHPGNLTSIYKRNSRLLKKTGDRVHAGTPLAIMGKTGGSENKTVHLHFELWYNGFPVNPLDYLVIH